MKSAIPSSQKFFTGVILFILLSLLLLSILSGCETERGKVKSLFRQGRYQEIIERYGADDQMRDLVLKAKRALEQAPFNKKLTNKERKLLENFLNKLQDRLLMHEKVKNILTMNWNSEIAGKDFPTIFLENSAELLSALGPPSPPPIEDSEVMRLMTDYYESMLNTEKIVKQVAAILEKPGSLSSHLIDMNDLTKDFLQSLSNTKSARQPLLDIGEFEINNASVVPRSAK